MHQRQCQRGIGAGQQLQMLMAFVGGLAFAWIYADQLGPIALGHLRIAPEMQIAGNAVAAPDQDELAFGKKFHPHAQLAAIGVGQRLAARAGADGAVQQAGTQLVKKAPVHAFALHQAHGAGVAVGKNRLGVVLRNVVQALGYVGKGLVPTDGGELAAALGAAALERLQHAACMVGALRVLADLGAENTIGVCMLWVALDLDGRAVCDGGDEGAGVRAVMRAGAAYLSDVGHVMSSKNRSNSRKNRFVSLLCDSHEC